MSNRDFCIARRKAERAAFVKVIKAMPEARLDYKPEPRSRTAAELAWVIAAEEASLLGLLDTGSIDWQDIEQALALGQQGAMQRARYRDPLIIDLAKNMGWMQCFHDEAQQYEWKRDSEENLVESLSSEYTTAPVRRTSPKVGRNEPCPCGSGQKFKKCCAPR